MATNETIDPRHPLGTRPQKPVKPKKPKKTGHKLRNTLLALAGAGILGGAGYALLSDSNDTNAPQTPVPAAQKAMPTKAAVHQAFPAFNPDTLRMNPEIYQAYCDFRGATGDSRFPAARHGDHDAFLELRRDLYTRIVGNLKSSQYKTVDGAIQGAVNEQFSLIKKAIVDRETRQYDMKVKLPFGNGQEINLEKIHNQVMTQKMAKENKKWLHKKELTPQMINNSVIYMGRVDTALGQVASYHLQGFTKEQALKITVLFDERIMDPMLLQNAYEAQVKETRPKSDVLKQAVDYVFPNEMDAYDRYGNTLEKIKQEIERGTDAYDATIWATNQYKTDSNSSAQNNKTDSFVYRFGAATQLLAGKTKAQQLKALDEAIAHPNIVGRSPAEKDTPWAFMFMAGAVIVGGVYAKKLHNKLRAKYEASITGKYKDHTVSSVKRKFVNDYVKNR